MNILSWIGDIFKPAATLVDELHVSDEERGKLRNELAKIQNNANSHLLTYETKLLEAKAKIQIAESNSTHTITAIWRPVASLSLVAIIVLASFGIIPTPAVAFYELAKIILGGYVGGRSLEKVASVIKLGGK